MELAAPRYTFTPLREDDLELVRAWLLLPHVRAWYDDVATATYPDDAISERRLAIRGEDPTDHFLIRLDGRPIGDIQSYRVPAVGIDLFIGEVDLIGRGHGPALIRSFLRDVAFPRYGVDRCVIGPSRGNTAAIRAYGKAGFRFLKTYLEPDAREPEHYLMELSLAELDADRL